MSRRRIKRKDMGIRTERRLSFGEYPGEARVFASEFRPGTMSDFEDYMEAHRLMPYNYSYDPETCGQEVREAIATLHEVDPSRRALLRAIAILGHSPCTEAIRALAEFNSWGGPFSGAASLALAECSGMFGQGYGAGLAM